MQAPAVRKPTTADLHWAAGFLEGEGSFSLTKSTPIINATQAFDGRENLERLLQVFGGSYKRRKRNPNSPKHHKERYQWWVSGWRAVGIMMTLYGLLSTRRKQRIKEVLEINRAAALSRPR